MNTLIYGKRKQGKSTLALALGIADHDRVVVFDSNGVFPLIQQISLAELPEWVAQHPEGSGMALVRVGPFDTPDLPKAFTGFANRLMPERDISVIVDEAHLLQGVNVLHPALDRWNRQSPASVSLIQTTHRIVDAHTNSRYHADRVFFFYAYLSRELRSVEENFGGDVSGQLPLLRPHQVVYWSRPTGGTPVWSVWDNGADWFIDLENDNYE